MVIAPETLSHLNAEELRAMVQSLLQTVTFKQTTIDKLTHENAVLKRLKFAATSERFSAEQKSLLEEEIEADLAAVATEIDALAQARDQMGPDALVLTTRKVFDGPAWQVWRNPVFEVLVMPAASAAAQPAEQPLAAKLAEDLAAVRTALGRVASQFEPAQAHWPVPTGPWRLRFWPVAGSAG